jgi:hypothetical protein
MKVQANLLDALNMLSRPQLPDACFHRQRYFWIDAICINQANNEERSLQVVLMTTIYSTAMHVVSWLGPEDPTTSDALTVIKKLARFVDTSLPTFELGRTKEELKWVTVEDFHDPNMHISKLGMQPININDWLAFVFFCRRPYFHRVVGVLKLSFRVFTYLD